MRLLPAILLCLSAVASELFVDTTLPFVGQTGWSPSVMRSGIQVGPYVGTTNSSPRSGTITLGVSYPAGTYYVHWLVSGGAGQNIGMTAGGGTGWATPTNNYYSVSSFTASSSFNSIACTVTNSGSGYVTRIHGVYFTTNANETALARSGLNTVFQGGYTRIIDTTPASTTNTTQLISGNLIPNSSFELGLGGGWAGSLNHQYKVSGGTTDVLAEWLDQGLTNDAHSGSYGVYVGDRGVRFTLYSPPLILRGDNEWKPYTATLWAKGSGRTVTWKVSHPETSIPGFTAWTELSRTFSPSPGATWQQYSMTGYMCLTPGRKVMMTVAVDGPGTNYVVVDDLMLVEGTNTVWEAAHQTEFLLDTDKRLDVFDVSDSRDIQLRWYNTGGSADRTINYEVFDWRNKRIASGTNSYTVPGGASTNTITLTTTNLGWSRIVAWCDQMPVVRSECAFSVIDIPNTPSVLATNGFWGSHPNYGFSMVRTQAAFGIFSSRSLSPAQIFRWNNLERTNDVWAWGGIDGYPAPDLIISNCVGATEAFVNLEDKYVPTWTGETYEFATTPTTLMYFSNYVNEIVKRYKNDVHYWEGINELNQATSITEAYAAEVMKYEAAAVKDADPNAFLVGFGGWFNAAVTLPRASNTWCLLDATTQSRYDAVSTHQYPEITVDQNETEIIPTRWTHWKDFSAAIGKPVWNTESGTWGVPAVFGDSSGWPEYGIQTMPWQDDYEWQRALWLRSEQQAYPIFRSMGFGFERFYYYDGRIQDYNLNRWDSQPTIIDPNMTMNSMGATLFTLANRLPKPTLVARPTHTGSSYIEAYALWQDPYSVIVAWNRDRTNRTMTTTNAAIGVYDLNWNLISTNSTSVPITRNPRVWISSQLSTNQMLETFLAGSVANVADNTAPYISIDISPHGNVTTAHLPLRFKWTASDDQVNSGSYPSMVQTRYKVNGHSDWSDWQGRNFLELDSIPETGVWYLQIEAKDSAGNTSTTLDGPAFGPGDAPIPVPVGGTLNVGTLNVGNIQ